MAADYYTLDSVRDQIRFRGQLDTDFMPRGFPDNWRYCPCLTATTCTRVRACQISIGVFFNEPHIGRAVIDIIYMRDRQNGFIRTNHMKLNQLIEKGLVDGAALKVVTF